MSVSDDLVTGLTYHHRRSYEIGNRQAVLYYVTHAEPLSLAPLLLPPEHDGLRRDVYLLCLERAVGEDVFQRDSESVIWFHPFHPASVDSAGCLQHMVSILYWQDRFWTGVLSTSPDRWSIVDEVRKRLSLGRSIVTEIVYEIEAVGLPQDLQFAFYRGD